MYAREGHTFGDTWYFVRGEEAHLFGLTKPAGSEHGWDIGHLVSNFRGHWFLLGTEHAEEGARISDPYPVIADETGVHVTGTSG